ncbi:hypothetical protein FEM48_Zijuj09G0044800 [Ziziphus jujuba var. spinosa]|uniref:PGG domain-containing protein n=1 Tax=Ziziphus jujuba var. spinosa TaxID=714518 RepID=A0A978UQW7_ZIZJJ|nr:hypothetical protein FEM48_Zijuj09G0044800 [Ziziphus jujuba var. spinosa]
MRIKIRIEDIREIRKKDEWSVKLMDKLLEFASIYEYVDPTEGEEDQPFDVSKEYLEPEQGHHMDEVTSSKVLQKWEKEGKIKAGKLESKESAILIAAKNGIEEIVTSILEDYPVAINDRDARKKNILILAAENRDFNLFNFLINKNFVNESIAWQMDDEGNTVLHATAFHNKLKLWPVHGAAAQMQWEIKWFEYVKSSMPCGTFYPRNYKGQSAEEIFTETHEALVKKGANWLVKTSESISVAATVVAGVVFATSSSIPDGLDEKTGKPKLEKQVAFQVFSISSLLALCFSVTALTMFLVILTSGFRERDFRRDLPLKLIFGLTSLFISITSMLVSFTSGHSLMTEAKFRYAVFPVYAVACLPISIFAVAQFPLYLDLLRTNFKSRFEFRRSKSRFGFRRSKSPFDSAGLKVRFDSAGLKVGLISSL